MVVTGERVLITGASGFIGACLARDLIAAGQEVHLMLRQDSRTWRLDDLAGRFTPHCADLRDAVAVRSTVLACRPTVVFHAAAHGTFHFQNNRAEILTSNLLGTAHLLDALDGHDYRALVNVGSSSEYGHKEWPIRDEDVLEPRSDYAVAKAAATLLCQAEFYKGRPVVTVRIFSAYGPWEDSGRIASYVMGCYLRDEAPRLTAATQPRDFIYIDDVIELLKTAAVTPAAYGHILHAGSGRRQTVGELVETIKDVSASPARNAEYAAYPQRPDEPTTWVADIGATTTLTGWQPRTDLRTGVDRMWQWFRMMAQTRVA